MPSVILRPGEEPGGAKQSWQTIGAAGRPAETRKSAEATVKALAEHDEGKTNPSTATGCRTKSKEAEQPLQLNFYPTLSAEGEAWALAKTQLPAGSKVTGVTLHVYGKAAANKAKDLKLEVFALAAGFMESTTTGWHPFPLTLAAKDKEELSAQLTAENGLKLEAKALYGESTAALCEIFKWYIVVEYEEGAGGETFSGSIAQRVGLTQSVSGFKATGGAAAQQAGVRQAFTGLKAAAGATAQALGLRQSNTGIKAGVGTVAQQAGVKQSATGSKTTSGTAAQAVGVAQVTSGFKRAAGAIAQQLGIRQSISNVLGGAVLQVFGLVQHVAGYKSAEGTARQRVGVTQATTGRKTVGGAVRSLIGLVQRIVGAVAGEEPAEQFGEPYEGLPRSPDAGSSPEVEPGRVETRELP